jgi:hypothetical protein
MGSGFGCGGGSGGCGGNNSAASSGGGGQFGGGSGAASAQGASGTAVTGAGRQGFAKITYTSVHDAYFNIPMMGF